MGIVFIGLTIIAFLCVLWLWAIAPSTQNKEGLRKLKEYDYAHRGLHDREKGVPENSLKAFSLAALGGFGMELDVQLTRDYQVVVHHDLSIHRSCGAEKNISELTYEELSSYRLFGTEEKIPLFSEVLKAVGGRTPIIVELKGYNDPAVLGSLTMELLRDYKGLYCVESFDPRIVRWFRENHPQIIRGQLMERLCKGKDGLTAWQAFCGRNLMTNCWTRPHFEAYDFTARGNLSLKTAKRFFGMQEVSWTLRTAEAYEKARDLGNICIFEGFLPLCGEKECSKKSFEEILADSKAVVYSTVPAETRKG